jgi:hypothetical protein
MLAAAIIFTDVGPAFWALKNFPENVETLGPSDVIILRPRTFPARRQPKHKTMNYMLLIAETQADLDQRANPVKARSLGEAWQAYAEALRKAGVFVRGTGLQSPQTATTIRVRDGKRQVQDGPYAETKELLGSVIVIDVPNLDAALEWAARCPVAAWGAVEVRPVWPGAAEPPDKSAT